MYYIYIYIYIYGGKERKDEGMGGGKREGWEVGRGEVAEKDYLLHAYHRQIN